MTASKRSEGKAHRFGGDWTDTKLKVLQGYLKAYTTALQNFGFHKSYIDAFAGTGYRDGCREDGENLNLLLPNLNEEEPKNLLDGSARIALKTHPRFDSYIFIERSLKRCSSLDELKSEFPDIADRVSVRHNDANEEIQKICRSKTNWSSHRAVLFLDPYGMQVDWTTIEAIAATEAIDLWLLFPLGIAVTRLLPKSGVIPSPWKARLNSLFGTEDWYERFYNVGESQNLEMFDDGKARPSKANVETIGKYFNDRLGSIFPGVVRKPGVLKNGVNNPLYLLCFAVGSRRAKAQRLALRIANHLLKGIQ